MLPEAIVKHFVESENIDNSYDTLPVTAALGEDVVLGGICESVVVADGLSSSENGHTPLCTPRVRANAQINDHATNLIHCSSNPLPQAASLPKAAPKWSSLFSKLSNNAGVYTPRCFDTVVKEGMLILPEEMLRGRCRFLEGLFIGFFPRFQSCLSDC